MEMVTFEDGLINIYPKDGYVYTDETGITYADNYTLFTVALNDPGIYDMLDEYEVDLKSKKAEFATTYRLHTEKE